MKFDPLLLQQLQRQLDAGYTAFDRHQPVAACRVWAGAWRLTCQIVGLNLPPSTAPAVTPPAASPAIPFLNALSGRTSLVWIDFAHVWPGRQPITSWALDFDMALTDAGQDDATYYELRTEFCHQFLSIGPALAQIQAHRLLRSLAIAYYQQGETSKGDAVFSASLSHQPGWTWGWISWADQYWAHPGRSTYDPGKAEQILQRALALPQLDDRRRLVLRTREFYAATGRPDLANTIR